MADRYFADSPISGDRAVLSGSEAHHLARVMRAAPGTDVVLFDGSGCEYEARVCRVGRGEVELEVLSRAEVNRELPFELTLAVALPKGDRQKWLVEKVVELGVSRLLPLAAGRSVAQPSGNALERLRRWVIEASKQCGRNRLLEIAEPQPSLMLFATRVAATRLLAHPLERQLGEGRAPFCHDNAASDRSVLVAIGPEGGFTAEEVMSATEAGWRIVDLGPRVLRVETAAIAMVAAVGLYRNP